MYIFSVLHLILPRPIPISIGQIYFDVYATPVLHAFSLFCYREDVCLIFITVNTFEIEVVFDAFLRTTDILFS